MTTQTTRPYAIGAKVWYRRAGTAGHERPGVVEDITLGEPPITYCVRLTDGENVWVAFSDLQPR